MDSDERQEVERAMPHETCLVYTPYRRLLDVPTSQKPIGFFGRVISRVRPDLATILGFQIEEHSKRLQVNRSSEQYEQPAEATLNFKLKDGIYVLNEKKLGDILVGCEIGQFAIEAFGLKNYGAPFLNLIRELVSEIPSQR